MDPRLLIRMLAYARIGLGIALFAAPRTTARRWLRREVSPAAGVLARGLGARDIVVGVGMLVTVDDGDDIDRWMDAGITADLADTAAALMARDDLEPRTVAGTMAVTLGAAGAGLALERALTDPDVG